MSINFRNFLNVVEYVTDIRKPILLRSRHGVGKSEVVYQFAKQKGLKVIERRASQMSEGDLLGLPKIESEYTQWLPPEWLYIACKEPVVLFVDEIDRATNEVRQGFFELTDSRKIAGSELHHDTLIFAAVNGGENYAAQYQVYEMDPAELSRWTVFDLDPDVEDWINWGKLNNNLHETVRNFILSNPTHLEHIGQYEPNKVYPSRRSWKRLNDCFVSGNFLNSEETIKKKSNEIFFLSQSFVGLEASVLFHDYVKNLKLKISAEDILINGEFEKIEKFTFIEHNELSEKILGSNLLTKDAKNEIVLNLIDYIISLPAEIGFKVVFDIGQKDIELLKRVYKESDNQILKYMNKILKENPEIYSEKSKKQEQHQEVKNKNF